MDKQRQALGCFVLSLFLLGGCADTGEKEDSQLSLIKTTNPPAIELNNRPEEKSIAYQVRDDLNKVEDIYDVAVVEGKKETIVAFKVKHMQRFRMKKIEKNITKRLEKKYPDEKFIVSNDYKIFLEAVRLKDDMDHNNLSKDAAEKRFKKIIKLKKEMT